MSEKIVKCAVIGAGAIGHDHIRGFQQHPSARVVAVAETSPVRAKEACDAYHIPEAAADYRALLKRDDIDVFSVALPNALHGKVGLDVVRAGKALMMDKPFATSAAEAAKIVATARAKKLVFMVGQNQRFSPDAQTLKQIVARGDLGEVYHAEAFWLRRGGIPRIGSWFTQKAMAGGGCTYDIGVHALDLCLHLLGDFEAAAVSGKVFTKFGNRGLGNGGWGKSEIDPKAKFDVDDFALAMIKMKSGRTVILRASWAAHMPVGDENGVVLYGTEAGARSNPLRLFRPGREAAYQVEEVRGLPALVPGNRMVHFIDCVLGKAKPFVKPEESLHVQRILDGIYKSAATGREVRLA